MADYFKSSITTLLPAQLILIFGIFLNNAIAQIVDAPIRLQSASGTCVPTTEICGDFIDQDCDGSDTLCSGNDKDLDGHTDSNDCNDANRRVYPGVTVQCSGGCGTGHQTCQSNGSFTACSCNALCEATGGGRCYYVSKLTGSDSNPGTFDQPFRTYLNFVSYYSSSEKPSTAVDLSPGDVVYFMSGVYNENYTYQNPSTRYAFYLRGVNGTAANPITFKAYPGAHPIISSSEQKDSMHIIQSSYINIEGLEITGGFGSGIYLNSCNNFNIRNNHIYNTDGTDNNNMAGIHFKVVRNSNVSRNIIHDNYDRTNADTSGNSTANSRNMVLFDGSDNRISYNVIFHSQPVTAQKSGGCLVHKHSADYDGFETQIFEVDHNLFWNCKHDSIGSGSHRSRIHHNLILDSFPAAFKDFGGYTVNQDNIFEHNTIVRSRSFVYNPTSTYEPIGDLTFRNNVVLEFDTSSSLEGAVNIYTYGSNTIYNQVVPANKLHFNSNCYYNSSEPSDMNLFASNSGGSNNLGGHYTFSEWQGLGYDSGSFSADPQLNSEYIPGNSSCSGFGHRAGW